MPTFEARPLASVQPRRADRAAVRQTTSSHTILGLRAIARHPILLILAYAAQGDVKRATAAAEQHRLGDFRLAECYQDGDLGPLLRRESFREFRKKFPEPKGAE